MMMDKKILDIPSVFKSAAGDIRKSRDDAIRIHGTSDIRAAGAEVELSVRELFQRMLPPRYYVTQGHLIDVNGAVSSQLDLIIADTFNMPSLMTTKDGTKYIPIDSVYAIGEIKSTYKKSEKYIENFSNVVEDIKNRLVHKEIQNTAFGGTLRADTKVRDMAIAKGNRVLNKLFTFMLFVDSGDFAFEDIASYFLDRPINFLPNQTVLLNSGIILHAAMKDNGFVINRYPDEAQDADADWYFSPFPGDNVGSLDGNHLGYLYYTLVEHLSNSFLEPPTFGNFISKMAVGRKSLLKKAKP